MASTAGHPMVAEKHVAAHLSRRSWVGGCEGTEWILGCAMTSTAGHPMVAKKHVVPAHFFRRSRVGGCQETGWILGVATRAIQRSRRSRSHSPQHTSAADRGWVLGKAPSGFGVRQHGPSKSREEAGRTRASTPVPPLVGGRLSPERVVFGLRHDQHHGSTSGRGKARRTRASTHPPPVAGGRLSWERVDFWVRTTQ